MNFKYIDKKTFIVKVNQYYLNNNELNESIKKILLLIKNRYSIDIYGFYDVDLYIVNSYLNILIFNKKDNDDLYYKVIDLKINKHYKNNNIIIDDFVLANNYKNDHNFLKICEHYFLGDEFT